MFIFNFGWIKVKYFKRSACMNRVMDVEGSLNFEIHFSIFT